MEVEHHFRRFPDHFLAISGLAKLLWIRALQCNRCIPRIVIFPLVVLGMLTGIVMLGRETVREAFHKKKSQNCGLLLYPS